MPEKNIVPTDDLIVRVVDDITEPGKTETDGVAGDTVNEPSKPDGQEGKRSAGQVIAELGNEKKTIAASLIRLAKSNESARAEAKKLLVEDPSMASYMKAKFSEDYSLITGEQPITTEAVDLEKIREEERTKAQADVLKEQLKTNQQKTVEAKAKELGLNTEEFEQFKRKVEILGGDEQAIADAALIVNSTKASSSDSVLDIPSGGEAGAPVQREVTITTGLNNYSTERGLNKKEFASDIDRVRSLHAVDRLGKPMMVLPGLK